MGGNLKDRWSIPVTVVANEFIDEYMAAANGEYVKVYLYVLRHQRQELTIDMIADGLNHTESDVRRALTYWERQGVLSREESPGTRQADGAGAVTHTRSTELGRPVSRSTEPERHGDKTLEVWSARRDSGEGASERETAASEAVLNLEGETNQEEVVPREPVHSQDLVNRLAQDEEFSQLLYIAQKYMNRVFTPRDCQVFAYLYEELGMKGELLEYLVEYCVQNGHSSVRYIEAVALNWHEKDIKTVRDAKLYSASYNQDSFAVMKAFGLNSRKPALPEQKLMDKWFKDFGFSREIVLEACSRTITAIHNPSFQYTDKILTDWKRAGVKSLADVEGLDTKRTAEKEEKSSGERRRSGQEDRGNGVQQSRSRKGAPNQFHNFEQRDTDYDALMLKQVREWVGEQS